MIEYQAFSTYVVEINQHNLFNTFRFDAYYPMQNRTADEYRQLQQLI